MLYRRSICSGFENRKRKENNLLINESIKAKYNKEEGGGGIFED